MTNNISPDKTAEMDEELKQYILDRFNSISDGTKKMMGLDSEIPDQLKILWELQFWRDKYLNLLNKMRHIE